MRPRHQLFVTCFACCFVASCAARQPAAPTSAGAPATTSAGGIDESALDATVAPCDDFYAFACGGWLKRTPIPPDRPAWFRSFSEINERNLTLLRELLETYRAAPLEGDPDARKLGDFYASCMDEARAETASLETLRAELRALDAVTGGKTLPARLAALHLAGVHAFFGFGSQQDFKDATRVIGVADQAGLRLPDRDYYLETDAKSVEIRGAYEAHIAKMLTLAGDTNEEAKRAAQVVLRIETALARASSSRVDRRSPENIYHRLERAGLVRIAPLFGWDAYFSAVGRPDAREINVTAPKFFEAMSALLGRLPAADVRAYLRWHLVATSAPALGQAFVDESFAFSSKHLTGEEQILPRWKRCVQAVESGLGEALGRPFVARTFGEEGKLRAARLIKGIEHAFAGTLAKLDWMDEPTRVAAQDKLHRVYNKVGYPAKWRDYGPLEIDRASYLGNRLRAAAFENRRDLAKIGKPVDRGEWYMPPQAVNAYYDPSMNEMVFPAGILQPPFFDRAGGNAENFGGIGMVMGHELTHGFDDEGRKFDGVGNLRQWWTPAVTKAFEARTACVAKQYDAYEIEKGVNVNGKLTLGENIADIGGLKMAQLAFAAQPAASTTAASAGTVTPSQRFFIAFAQTWCANRRAPYARMLVTVDPHAPPQFRVNGVVANQPEFQTAFSCRSGAPMAPVQRCAVW